MDGDAAVFMRGAGAELMTAARERVGRARGRIVVRCMIVDALIFGTGHDLDARIRAR